ncbi:MAG: hypothetical protein LBU37_14760 [Tannerellaceae bacterium]|jgi:hypothetical protein|nr:hypothetical protein [Tannerellaceae bacterium]
MAFNFSVTFPSKPYVRLFIEQNYGNPVRFYRDKAIMSLIRLMLQKKDTSLQYRPVNKDIYSDTVTFYLNETDYNHYGDFLSNQAIMDINRHFEQKVRMLMRSWCSAQYFYGMPAIDTVKYFQERFGYPEHIWKAESMYKDCQRNNIFSQEKNLLMEQKITEIILSQLSRNRTITQQAKRIYEDH